MVATLTGGRIEKAEYMVRGVPFFFVVQGRFQAEKGYPQATGLAAVSFSCRAAKRGLEVKITDCLTSVFTFPVSYRPLLPSRRVPLSA